MRLRLKTGPERFSNSATFWGAFKVTASAPTRIRTTQVYALAPTFLDLIDRASVGSVVFLRINAISNETVFSVLTLAIGRGCKVKLIINAVVHAGTDSKPRSVNHRLHDQRDPNLVAVEHRHSSGLHWNILHGKYLMTDKGVIDGSCNFTQKGDLDGINMEACVKRSTAS